MVDPGFPVGGVHPLGGHGPLTWVLFGENVCKNERIGSHRRWHAPGMPPPVDPPMIIFMNSYALNVSIPLYKEQYHMISFHAHDS